MNNLLQIAENLAEVRKTLGYRVVDFVDKFEMQYRTYQTYERGERKPPLEFFEQLNEFFNVNLNYIFTGHGEMFIKENPNTLARQNDETVYERASQFGKRLQEIQDKHNFLNREMAQLLKISEREYTQLKIGKKAPTISVINEIKRNFVVDVDWLMYGVAN